MSDKSQTPKDDGLQFVQPALEKIPPWDTLKPKQSALQSPVFQSNLWASAHIIMNVTDTPLKTAFRAYEQNRVGEDGSGLSFSHFLRVQPKYRTAGACDLCFGHQREANKEIPGINILIPQATYLKCLYERSDYRLALDDDGNVTMVARRATTGGVLPGSKPATFIFLEGTLFGVKPKLWTDKGVFPIFIGYDNASETKFPEPEVGANKWTDGKSFREVWELILKNVASDPKPFLRVEWGQSQTHILANIPEWAGKNQTDDGLRADPSEVHQMQ